MQPKAQLLGLPSYEPGKPIEEVKKELGLTKIIKLASNENPFGSSPKVTEAIKDAASQTAIYPDGYARTLRQAVAKTYHVKEDQLIFGNGSDEVIQFLCRTFLEKGTNTVTAHPTFSQYKLNATIEGASIREVPLKDGVHDLDAMLEAIDENTKIVWVCNPNNPTGTYVNKEAFEKFLNQVPPHVIVVSDEAYYEYVTADDYPETIPMLERYKQLIILRTFSKAYGLAALRVGFGVANKELISYLQPVRPPFNNVSFGQIAAATALSDQGFIKECVEKNNAGMKQLELFCDRHRLTYYPSETNFLLIELGRSGDEVFKALLKEGFIVRSGNPLGFSTAIRITIGKKEDNEALFQALERVLFQTPLTTQPS
ncbi:histidinol-phosphate transaminase [Alkalihalophilus lindianensis]|uniref:Histidinol-phosphate aminotransferase n=1 Tax=Alkalihalophilus lindianensis TaxID=1630542 RepID=A0ABU3X6F9_9BACI|nr:histidinol-phosphate transaminase [Alkalihalophilus lindianensis]MDV2683475.1 histidinol-phosphate transaminase [Alkalihalophilus lindianensis]